MARVSPQWAEGLACPHCQRPLMWIGQWRRDSNSPDGYSFRREPFTFYADRQIAREDRAVHRVVRRGGYEAETAVRYEHVCVLQCPRCSKMYSKSQASHVPSPPPGQAPAGYYLSEE